jgi:5'-nucleotidase/UDP-sugar diphosphatase
MILMHNTGSKGHDMKQTNRAYKRTSGIILLLALFLVIPMAAFPQTASLTILHTNDTHGHLLPFSYPSIVTPGSPLAEMPERKEIGGIARRATLARQIRNKLERKGTAIWLVDAGDFSDGTPFSTEYRGEADIAAMNAAGYDFATLGNHDFNYPLEQTLKLIGLARYQVLCANAVLKATGKPLAQAYRIEKVGPVRVGLFGLVTREASDYPAAKEGVYVHNEIATARKVVKALRSRADIIVLISHCGEEMDQKLAAEVKGIDVIVGGHSHSRLPLGEFVWHSEKLLADQVNGTIILQDHYQGGELGLCDLLFKKDDAGQWHVARYHSRLIPVTAAIQPDKNVSEVVAGYWNPIAPRYAEIMGKAAGDFTSRYDDQAEYNLVADLVRETFGTEIEFENIGGIRAQLIMGDITRADLVALDPFNNAVVTFNITGQQIREVLKQHAPAVSGIRYRLENNELEATVNGQRLQDDRIYTGASNSYFASNALKELALRDTGRKRLDVITDYIRNKGTIYPVYDGRRIVIGNGPLLH